MSVTSTVTGARAIVKVGGTTVGIYETCTYNRTYGTEPIHILGNYAPVEIPYTSAEAVTVSASGFRVVGTGVFTTPGVPTVGELLNFDPATVTLTVTDRQTNKVIFTLNNTTPNGDNGNWNARATSRVTVNYIGTVAFDEASPNGDSDSTGVVFP
jgi:hypothetical protein